MYRVCVVLCALGAVALGAQFPSIQERCPYGDTPCITRVANDVIKKSKLGYPELGIPIFDPLRIDKINIEQGGDSPVNLKINLKDFDLKGLSGLNFSKIAGFKADIEKSKVEADFYVPFLEIDGPYKIDGKVLVLPVQGKGIANLKFFGVKANLKMLMKKITKDGKVFLNVDKSKVEFDADNVKINFGNLFNGNKELGESTNQFFNENWKDILKEIKPAVSDAFAVIYKSLINNVFGNIPYDEMFLK